jgi:hypothetical protein
MSTKIDKLGETAEEQNENKIFEEYINMNQATMINIEELFKDVKNDKVNVEVAFETNKNKYQNKIDKIRKKK